jgi:hypothetical protein
MTLHSIENEAELAAAKAENVASMRVVADRCLNAEKLAWSTDYVMNKSPRAVETCLTLSNILHDYLSTTATMVKKINHDVLAVRLAQMGLRNTIED